MNKGLYFLIFAWVLSCQLASAQKNKTVPNGYNVYYYGDGKVSSEGNMKDGKPEGLWKTYYTNGKMKSVGTRKNFALDSIWVFYAENGDTTQKISYLYGKKNGFLYTYSSLTADSVRMNYLTSKELYVNDIKQGNSFTYYQNRQIHLVIPFKTGKRHGDGLEYDSLGTVISLIKYHNDYILERESINRTDAHKWKQGRWLEFYKNGYYKTDIEYVNDTIHGYFKKYGENGKLLSVIRYEKGQPLVENALPNKEKKIDVKTETFADGTVKAVGGFKDGKPVGIHRTFAQDGAEQPAKVYNDKGVFTSEGMMDQQGFMQGKWTLYYPTGEPKAKGEYKNDKRVGNWQFFYKNGKPEQKGEYKAGKPNGKWIWYYETGETLRTEEFMNGKEDGELVELNKDGSEITRGKYLDGEKTGQWIYFVGEEREEGSYRSGERHGVWKHYYPNGKLKYEGNYIMGNADGRHRSFYPNGKMSEDGEYAGGVKDGLWRSYDEQGEITLTVTYDRGEEAKLDGEKLQKDKDNKRK